MYVDVFLFGQALLSATNVIIQNSEYAVKSELDYFTKVEIMLKFLLLES